MSFSWVCVDYGMCHSADYSLCGTQRECVNRLSPDEIVNHLKRRTALSTAS